MSWSRRAKIEKWEIRPSVGGYTEKDEKSLGENIEGVSHSLG